MDPISYGVAAKQKQRIEQVIANPDSTSGIVTTPSVIAVGETISIPAGRTAVLPNTTVNGTLVVDGEVFIPSGSSYTATNINVSGVGSRITGDFTNAIIANRTFVQASQENGVTNLQTIPNGTAQLSGFLCFNNSNPTNSSWGHLRVDASTVALNSGVSGTGTYLPITFVTGGAERMRIDTAGNVLVTGSGGLGYGTGAGGTVTQLTSKSTAVTLNKPTGEIITSNESLVSGGETIFVVNNSLVTTRDAITVNPSLTNKYTTVCQGVFSGGFYVRIKNVTGGSLSESFSINFYITKGVNA